MFRSNIDSEDPILFPSVLFYVILVTAGSCQIIMMSCHHLILQLFTFLKDILYR